MAAKRKATTNASFTRVKTSGTKSSQAKSTKPKLRLKSVKQNSKCPIVGIGGSAGGFEAAMELLQNLPPRTGMAFEIGRASCRESVLGPGDGGEWDEGMAM